MKVKTMKVKDIKFTEASTKVYDPTPSADLRRSIGRFGVLVRPVVSQFGLISGHRRVSEAKARGQDEVEVEVRDVETKEEHEALVFEYNRQRKPTWRQRYGEGLHYERQLEKDYAALKEKGEALQISASEWVRGELEELMGLSHETWAQLKKVGRNAPELLDAIDTGKLNSLNAAHKKLKAERPELFKTKKKSERPDFQRLFEDGYTLGWQLGNLVTIKGAGNFTKNGGFFDALIDGLVAGLKRQAAEVDMEPHAAQVEGWCPTLKKPLPE